MYLVKILNADHRPVDVEVSLEIYRVYEESRKQEERQRDRKSTRLNSSHVF